MGLTGLLGHAVVAWRSGWRSNSFRLLSILCLAMLAMAFFAAAFSMRQPLVVAMDVGVTGMRLAILLLALFWVQELFSQDITHRTVFLMLAYPISRTEYLLGRFAGIAGLVAFALLFYGVLLLGVVKLSAWGYADSSAPLYGLSYCLMLVGIYLDILVLLAFALCISTFSETPFLPLSVTFFFAVVARSYDAVLSYLKASGEASEALRQNFVPLFDALGWVLPNLSRLDWRDAVLYGQQPPAAQMLSASAMATLFIALMLMLASLQFQRRQLQ